MPSRRAARLARRRGTRRATLHYRYYFFGVALSVLKAAVAVLGFRW